MEKQNIEKTIKLMGRNPINPIGECFDSSLCSLFRSGINQNQKFIDLKDIKLCHGIGVCNAPGQEGETLTHAWLEFTDKEHESVAVDTTWGVMTEADHYRKQIKISYVIEYTPEEAFKNWKKSPAPWDKKIKSIIKKRTEK